MKGMQGPWPDPDTMSHSETEFRKGPFTILPSGLFQSRDRESSVLITDL